MIGGAFWPHSEKVITIGCQPVSWGSSPHVVANGNVNPSVKRLADSRTKRSENQTYNTELVAERPSLYRGPLSRIWPGIVTNPLSLRLDYSLSQTVDCTYDLH